MLEDYIDKEVLYIVKDQHKEKIIERLSRSTSLVKMKVLSWSEFIKNYVFDYNEEAFVYLYQVKKIKPEITSIYLENMYYVDTNKKYTSFKLNQLKELKKELFAKNLLKTNPSFLNLVKRKKILVDSYTLDDYKKKLLNEISTITEVIYLTPPKKEKNLPLVYRFDTMEEEVRFVARSITEMHLKGIPFSKMHLLNVSNEYDHVLNRIFSFYHIPIEKIKRASLYSLPIAQDFLSLCEKSKTFEEVFTSLEKDRNPYFQDLIQISNRFSFYEGSVSDLVPLLKRSLQSTFFEEEEAIEKVTVDEYYFPYQEDDFVFLLGCNQESFPPKFKDNRFLGEEERSELGFSSILDRNRQEKEHLLSFLYSLSTLTITYKLKSAFALFFPSSILEEEYLTEKAPDKSDKFYSHLDEALVYASFMDRYIKYNEKSSLLDSYYAHFKEIPYRSYQNDFTGISSEKWNREKTEKLHLSYSSIDQFFRCNFRYYASQLLKLEPRIETFDTKVGTLFHTVLALAFTPSFDFDTCFQEALKDFSFDKKEMFFLKKLKEELRFAIEMIKKQDRGLSLTDALFEKKIEVRTKKNQMPFVGIIDKMHYQEENGNTLVQIVDYKTGSATVDLSNLPYGIGMQLPIYLYLVKKSELFSNVRFVGFYLQKILHNEVLIDSKKTYQEVQEALFRLKGYSNSDLSLLEKIDPNYANSTIIDKMKLTSKGFSSYSKVLNDIEMDRLVSLVESKIDEATDAIIEGDFKINPKQIDKDLVGCMYCPFRALCYRKGEDIVYLEKLNNLSFLRGDNNA